MTLQPNTAPLVTVVIPTRNRRPLLEEAVASVRRQTYRHWELIVVDDCSDDGTWAWLQQLDDPRIRATRLDRHSERSAARNRGLREARGEYILFLDDDDRLMPHALQRLVHALERSPGAVAAAGGRVVFDGLGHRLRTTHSLIPFLRRRPWRDVLIGWVSIQGATLLRTRVQQAVGGWSERLAVAEDQELLLRVGLEGALAVVPSVVLENRAHDGQWRPRDTAVIEEEFRREFVDRLVGPDRQLGERLLRARVLLKQATDDYQKGKFLMAAGLILGAVREEPPVLLSPLTGPGTLALWLKAVAGLMAGRRVFARAKSLRRVVRRARGCEIATSVAIVDRSARLKP